MSAVIRRGIAEHIEEQSVHVIAVERFTQYLRRLLAIPSAIHARLVETVVNRRLSVGLFKKPFRMGSVSIFVRFAEIKAADDANSMLMRSLQDLGKIVVTLRHVGTDIVILHLARIKG